MYYTIYKITNLLNGKYYIGKHKTANIDDGYVGSGVALKNAYIKHGKENFVKEILFIFDNEVDMDLKEKELVQISEHTYNMTEGGRGGFSYIQRNGLNSGANNVMHIPEVKAKQTASMLSTRNKNKTHYDTVAINNLKRAVEHNTGKKRPEHSILMKEKSKLVKMVSEDKEAFRDLLSSHFEVISPEGHIYTTNRLQDFCGEHNITYVPVWNTSRTGRPVTKGKSKGWLCKKI